MIVQLPMATQPDHGRHAEVARGSLRIVAAGGAGLATGQVVRVLLEMARAGMAREADALAALLSAPGVRKAPQVQLVAASGAFAVLHMSLLCRLEGDCSQKNSTRGVNVSQSCSWRTGGGACCCHCAGPSHGATDAAVLRSGETCGSLPARQSGACCGFTYLLLHPRLFLPVNRRSHQSSALGSLAGLVALAALFTHSWRAGNALSAIQEWTKQVESSSADPDKITILAPRTI